MTPEQREELKRAAQLYKQLCETRRPLPVAVSDQCQFYAEATPDAILPLIAQVEALTVPQWISVETALPELGQQVIAYRPTAHATQDTPVRLVRYTGAMRESWQGMVHGFDCMCHPTHWMALPTIPAIPGTKEDAT